MQRHYLTKKSKQSQVLRTPEAEIESVGCSGSSIKEPDVCPGACTKSAEVGNEKTGVDGDVCAEVGNEKTGVDGDDCAGACTISGDAGVDIGDVCPGEVGDVCNGVSTVLAFRLRGGRLDGRRTVSSLLMNLTLGAMSFASVIGVDNPSLNTKPCITVSVLPTLSVSKNPASKEPFRTPETVWPTKLP